MLSILLVTAAIPLRAAEDSGRKGLVNAWHGHRVVLKQTLYSIVYDERSRFLPAVKQQGKTRGMTVTTPNGTYYEFEAVRDSEEDIVERDPNGVVSSLRNRYRRAMHLDLGNVQ